MKEFKGKIEKEELVDPKGYPLYPPSEDVFNKNIKWKQLLLQQKQNGQ